MRHRVVISGLGALSPLGVGVGALWNGLKASRSGLRYSEKLGSVVGEVPDFPSERWSRGEQREMSRGSQFALLAAEECLQDAKLGNDDAENTGVNIGMGIADLEMIEETAELIRQGKAKRVTPYFVPRILTNMPAGYVSMKYGLKGGNMSSTTACATGASCVGDAATMVALGRVRRMIAGAVESCVNPIAITGFNRLRALARGQTGDISRPFDKTREGFVLSEGGAVVLLERLEDARTRGAPIYAEVLGYGISSDAYHLTSPDESGIGGRLCMGRSLEDAAVKGQEVSYVNAHATSTPMGDRIEAKSIASVCPSVAASSIKGHLGHCLAAAGSLEIVATALMLHHGLLIGNLNLGESDVEEDLRLLKTNEEWSAARRIALVNSFGFGGANVSLCMAEP